jgi:predicted Fe-S protein YdhL (DUF1289 family)
MNAANLIAARAAAVCASGQKDIDIGLGVESPCVSVCQLNAASTQCIGCLRTLDEIGAWSVMDAPAKRAVWALLAQRAAGILA